MSDRPFEKIVREASRSCDSAKALARAVVQAYVKGLGPKPMCRDCADEDGVCPSSGQPCDTLECALEYLTRPHTPDPTHARIIKAAEDAAKALWITEDQSWRLHPAVAAELVAAVNALHAAAAPQPVRPEEVEPGTRFRFMPHPGEAGTGLCVLYRADDKPLWTMDGDATLYRFGPDDRILPIPEPKE